MPHDYDTANFRPQGLLDSVHSQHISTSTLQFCIEVCRALRSLYNTEKCVYQVSVR